MANTIAEPESKFYTACSLRVKGKNRIITLKKEDIVSHNNNFISIEKFVQLKNTWFAIGKVLETAVVQDSRFIKVFNSSDDVCLIDTATSFLRPLVYCKCINGSLDILDSCQ